ncbi:MAG: GDP-mannose 4,6-dehydratase [Chloroflexota bacterium]
MRVLITGATGFAGSHLVDLLLAEQHDIFVLTHAATSMQTLPDHPNLVSIEGDLLDRHSLMNVVETAKPDVIYHLAGQAYPAKSWTNPAFTVAINTGGTANLLEAAVSFGKPRVVVVTSAEIYGRVTEKELPLTEATLPRPRHPYGISKWSAAEFVRLYWDRYQLPVFEARPFNHIGPRQALGFVVPDFASQIAKLKREGNKDSMQVGNLDAKRDFTDVRDVVRAYKTIAEKGQPGEPYLICTGQPIPIYFLLNKLSEIAGIDVKIEYDPARMRPSDVPILYGSSSKLTKHTGWTPQIHMEESLRDVFLEWEAKGTAVES